MEKVLVTGAAGFIGFHISKKLLDKGFEVHGIDNMNAYYDVDLKQKRLDILNQNQKFNFELIDISDYLMLKDIVSDKAFKFIFHYV